jgi:hypothetical protein
VPPFAARTVRLKKLVDHKWGRMECQSHITDSLLMVSVRITTAAGVGKEVLPDAGSLPWTAK